MRNTQRVAGRLIMVQESRFRIVTRDGQTFLFTLSRAAGLDELRLLDFYREKIPVAVEYEGEPGLASGIAHALSPVEAWRE